MSPIAATPFLIEPAEPLVFAPPKSASAGEAHHIASLFPPSPRTVQGLVRTRLLLGAATPLDLGDRASAPAIAGLVGPPDALPEGWQLRGPFPARVVPAPEDDDDPASPVLCPWVPTPRFLLEQPDPERSKRGGSDPWPPVFARRVVCPAHPVLSDLGDALGTPSLGRPDLGVGKPLGGWISASALRRALAGEDEGMPLFDRGQWSKGPPPFVRIERQPGVAIDPGTGTARPQALYLAQALRFLPESGLFGQLDFPPVPGLRAKALTEGAVQAGRKGRLVHFRPVSRMHPDWTRVIDGRHLPDRVGTDERFWLVALTPAFLPDPRRPLEGRGGGGPVAVIVEAALTGRLETVGGFDLVSGRPRPNRLYVPAGSAWLLRLEGGSPERRAATLRALHDRHPLGDPQEAAMGFGHTLVGRGPLSMEPGS